MSDILRATSAPTVSAVAITTCRPEAHYGCGEKVHFIVTPHNGPTPIDYPWEISKDGHEVIASGVIPAGLSEAVAFTALLNEPGFLRFTLTWGEGKKTLKSAGVAATAIAPSLERPADFDTFWETQRALGADVPMEPRTVVIPSPQDDLETIDFRAASAGGEISGYLVKPKGAAPGSLPSIIIYHGAGVISARMEVVALWASRGFMAIDLNAHGVPNGLEDSYYQQLLNGAYSDFRTRGNDSRDTAYFRGLFLRALRGIDFITSQPEWDGKTLIAFGSSMGAAQSITVSALDPRVTFTVAAVPAMCDHTGPLQNRSAGWPLWVPFSEAGEPDAARLEASRYYDMMNMASRLRNSFFVVGWADAVCTPTSIYAAFNQAGGTKTIYDDHISGHENTPAAVEQMRQAVMAHLEAVRA